MTCYPTVRKDDFSAITGGLSVGIGPKVGRPSDSRNWSMRLRPVTSRGGSASARHDAVRGVVKDVQVGRIQRQRQRSKRRTAPDLCGGLARLFEAWRAFPTILPWRD